MKPAYFLVVFICLILAVQGSHQGIKSHQHVRGRHLSHAATSAVAKKDDDDGGDDDDDDDDYAKKPASKNDGHNSKAETKKEYHAPEQAKKEEYHAPAYHAPEAKKEEYHEEEKHEEYPKKEEYHAPAYHAPEAKKEEYHEEEKHEEYPKKEEYHAAAYPPKEEYHEPAGYPEPAYFPTPHGETLHDEYVEMEANEQYCQNRRLRGIHRFLQGVYCPESIGDERRHDNIPSSKGWISFATMVVFCFLFCPGIIACCQSRGRCKHICTRFPVQTPYSGSKTAGGDYFADDHSQVTMETLS